MTTRELAAVERSAAQPTIKTSAILIVACVALMTVCSWIRVPGPIPVTMQTFAVFFTVSLLGTRRGAIAVASWLAIGLAGAPVFAGMIGGLPYLLGPTGGYIIGFIGTAFVTGAIIDRLGSKIPAMILAMVAGLAVCYAFGTAWFMVISAGSVALQGALAMCIVPFIVPDLIKIALAIVLFKLFGERVRSYAAKH